MCKCMCPLKSSENKSNISFRPCYESNPILAVQLAKIMRNGFFFTILGAFSLYFLSCSTLSVPINYLQPALINIPTSVQSIVVVDHSAPKNTTWDIIEGGLTGEGIGQDAEGILNLIQGIKEIGAQSSRYTLTKETQRYGKGKLLENIPQAMDISLIRNIGSKHGADAVLAIDKFDSDFITTDAELKTKKDPEDTTKVIRTYEVEGIASVVAYIRLYEVKTGTILDEIKLNDQFTYRASGSTVQEAMLQLMRKQDAVNDISYQTGLIYGRRIAPYAYTVNRTIYRRPKDTYLERGARKAEVADWKGAIVDWQVATKSIAKDKVKARAAYNIAVAYEVLGDLQNAQEWAQVAYVTYGMNQAKAYYDQLARRALQQEQLDMQMEETPSKR